MAPPKAPSGELAPFIQILLLLPTAGGRVPAQIRRRKPAIEHPSGERGESAKSCCPCSGGAGREGRRARLLARSGGYKAAARRGLPQFAHLGAAAFGSVGSLY
ncbi:hypothetical protein AV530_007236 [Patagioenas fasciata monilis]|uniref:Uncharacterized protein n=1 Tax=Patagioenas fasciata monilis TaxID=372326 RepID=A0A1V4JX00_PATFA|nr:hypothetical protein AV530_007236 [Patagioenas fasciata monilis]